MELEAKTIAKLLCCVSQGLLLWVELRCDKRGIEIDEFNRWLVAAVIAFLLIINLFI